jgi:hypothetical protein
VQILFDMVTAAFLARDSDDAPRALIACGTTRHAGTVWSVSQLVTQLDASGFVVELAVAAAHAMPTPADYDVIVAALSGRPWLDRPLLHWIQSYGNASSLATIGAFVIGNARRGARSIAKLTDFGWQPLATTVLPDHRYAAEDATALIQRFVTRLTLLCRARTVQGSAPGE